MADRTPWWKQRSSVRFRVTALAALVLLVVLAATAVVLVVIVRSNLIGGIDAELERRTADLHASVLGGTGDLDDPVAIDDESFHQVVVDGQVLAASGNVSGEPALADPPPAGAEDVIRTMVVGPVDDSSMRVLSRDVAGSANTVTHVGVSTEDLDETVAILATTLAVGVPVVAALLAALVWTLVGRTLRPVEAIRTEVAAIGARDLSRRVSVPASDDEIASLAATMNAMLERLEHSQDTLSRFVADASHELRSPLTRLRTHLEVGGTDIDHGELLDDTIDMQRLVEDLLLLARLDSTDSPTLVAPLDLDDVVHGELAQLDVRGLRVEADVEQVMVHGNGDQLSRAIRNVLENAVRYATSVVSVRVEARGPLATVIVEDDGPGIPEDLRTKVLERFYRVDDARNRRAGGTGLGLAIASEIASAHHGRIDIGAGAHGTQVTIAIPVAGVSADARRSQGRRPAGERLSAT